MTKEALKLALEAVEEAVDCAKNGYIPNYLDDWENAITAIKAALAQPEQEPVAWMSPSWIDPDTRGWQSDSFESIPIEGWLPIYTTPPQRTWVGLTDEEAQQTFARHNCTISTHLAGILARAIEAKLKDKNT
jgi:hypothetical protein